jgi:hypothetical protein
VFVSVLLVGYGLIVLNHMAYSFWLSSGPPNDFPQAWYQEGLVSMWQGIALVSLGAFVQFRLATLVPNWFFRVFVVLVVAGLIYPYFREWLLIDSCLDIGGAWDDQSFECQS